jgi:hypothetical protein
MIIRTLLTAVFAVIFLTAGSAGAAEFSAELINTHRGQKNIAKIYVQAEKMRMETPGTEEYTILRSDKKLIWIVIPDEKTYIEIPTTPAPRGDAKMKGEIGRELVGSETVNGYETKKYEVRYLDQDTLHKAHQWIASDLNYPIKISALDGSWSTEYRDIKAGPQDKSLFEIPEGFDRVSRFEPAPAVPQGK